MKHKIAILSIISMLFIFIGFNNVEAAGYEDNYATTSVNIRDSKTNEILGVLRKGDYIYGYTEGNWVYFNYNGNSAKVYREYIMQDSPETLYIKYPVNVIDRNNNIVGIKYTGDSVLGVRMGNYYRFYDNGVKFIWYSFATPNYVSYSDGVATSHVNIRSAATGNIVSVLKIGEYVEGYSYNNYIHFMRNGVEVKVYEPLIKEINNKKLYITSNGANVRNSNLNVVDQLNKGDVIYAVNLGEYYRYYENGVKLVHRSLVTTNYVSQTPTAPKIYSLSDFMWRGVINWSGYKFTYYSQSVLPGYGLSIPGRHVNSGGFVADKDGYIVLASNSRISRGTVINTPFGYQGKVYDRCESCSLNWYDVYTK